MKKSWLKNYPQKFQQGGDTSRNKSSATPTPIDYSQTLPKFIPFSEQQKRVMEDAEKNRTNVVKPKPEKRGVISKAGAIARNPMSAIQAMNDRGYVPDYIDMNPDRNIMDNAMDIINPMTYGDATGRLLTAKHLRDTTQNYGTRVFNTLMDLGMVTGLGSEIKEGYFPTAPKPLKANILSKNNTIGDNRLFSSAEDANIKAGEENSYKYTNIDPETGEIIPGSSPIFKWDKENWNPKEKIEYSPELKQEIKERIDNANQAKKDVQDHVNNLKNEHGDNWMYNQKWVKPGESFTTPSGKNIINTTDRSFSTVEFLKEESNLHNANLRKLSIKIEPPKNNGKSFTQLFNDNPLPYLGTPGINQETPSNDTLDNGFIYQQNVPYRDSTATTDSNNDVIPNKLTRKLKTPQRDTTKPPVQPQIIPIQPEKKPDTTYEWLRGNAGHPESYHPILKQEYDSVAVKKKYGGLLGQYQQGGKISTQGYTARTPQEQHEGLNNPNYQTMQFPMQGSNTFRGLDNGQPVRITDSKGKTKILRGNQHTDTFQGDVFEQRLPMAQNGMVVPDYHTTNPLDPRIQSYNDSLDVHNRKNLHSYNQIKLPTDYIQGSSKITNISDKQYKEEIDKQSILKGHPPESDPVMEFDEYNRGTRKPMRASSVRKNEYLRKNPNYPIAAIEETQYTPNFAEPKQRVILDNKYKKQQIADFQPSYNNKTEQYIPQEVTYTPPTYPWYSNQHSIPINASNEEVRKGLYNEDGEPIEPQRKYQNGGWLQQFPKMQVGGNFHQPIAPEDAAIARVLMERNRGKNFVDRAFNNETAPRIQTNKLPGNDNEGKPFSSYDPKQYSTELMGYDSNTIKNANNYPDGSARVYPDIVQRPGEKGLTYLGGDKSYDYADSTGEYITTPTTHIADMLSDKGYKLATGIKYKTGGLIKAQQTKNQPQRKMGGKVSKSWLSQY